MASFEIHWRSSTKKDLRRTPRDDVSRLITAVAKLADEPLPNGSEKLAGSDHTYRVVYELVRVASTVEIQRVRHRKDVYR